MTTTDTTAGETTLNERYAGYIDTLRETEPWLVGRAGQLDLVRIGVEVPACEYRLVNAPTATGKSLAALMIGGERARAGHRTVIATFTRLLQNQYRDKDFVKALKLFPDVEFCILKGANNYFCKVNAKSGLKNITAASYRAVVQAKIDADGEPGEPVGIPEFLFSHVTAEASDCRDHEPEECGYAAAKARAAKAKVVITNHMMVMVNGTLPQILGPHDLLIVDEIHNFPKAAESWGTKKIWRSRLVNLAEKDKQLVLNDEVGKAVEAINEIFMLIEQHKEERFIGIKELKAIVPWVKMLIAIVPPSEESFPGAFEDAVGALKRWVENSIKRARKDEDADKLKQLPTIEGLPWNSTKQPIPGEARLLLSTVDISGIAKRALRTEFAYKVKDQKELKSYKRAVLMMSATTGTASKDRFVAERCGLSPEDVALEKLKSPLNYQDQMRVSSVRVTGAVWTDAVNTLVGEMGGRSLVLCGSWAKVDAAVTRLREGGWTVFVQAKNNPSITSDAVEAFRQDEKSVLVGTASLYEGIDIQGASLSQVIIKDLPMIPGVMTPVGRERRRRLGDKWMSDMEIPYVATVLEQMAGRLIRSETDQGLVVILDDQAQSGWGKAAVYEGMETFGDVIVPRSQALTWLVPF